MTQEKTPEVKKSTCAIEVKPMAKWIEEKPPEGSCRPCMLAPTLQWYQSELEECGQKAMAADLKTLIEDGLDPLTMCQHLDSIKKQVGESLRERLLEFDCVTQLNEPTADDPKQQAD